MSTNKIWLIAGREYITRVRKKTFILATLLTPIGFAILMGLGTYFAAKGGEATKSIALKDASGILDAETMSDELMKYSATPLSLEELKTEFKDMDEDIVVYVPPFDDLTQKEFEVRYYTEDKLSIATINDIEKAIAKQLRDHKIENSEINLEIYNSFKTDITLENGEKLDQIAAGEEPKSSGKTAILVGTILAGLMGGLMYFVIFIYGGLVMRSVMEEKINRVVEIMVSSVKPVQMMLGKILGVGGVGLTQLAIWLILIPVFILGIQAFFGGNMDAQSMEQMQEIAAASDLSQNKIQEFFSELGSINWLMILPVFVIFFFGGYFIYASLFAAVGSAVSDDMGEAQQLMIPLGIPVFIGFMMLQGVLSNPNGSMAVFGSLFPLISPIIMPARLAFDPPAWQIVLSIVILIASCIFFAWIAGRIYRVGILLYGKKVSFKELWKWLFYKG